jgi:glycine/D-amino acid oxidase-like deaminating enzyme
MINSSDGVCMKRRLFLAGAVGAGLSTMAFAAGKNGPKLRIGVVGGGIVGAAIAMRCARAGAEVTLLEKTAPAAGATCKSFAWINPFMDDPHYMRVRLEALARWRTLDRPLGMGVVWGGYLGFTDKASDRGRMAVQSKHLAELGHPTRSLDAEALKMISPAINPGTLVEATWSDLGGHVDPVHATKRFLAAATHAGARILYPCPVTAIEPEAGGVTVVTPRSRLRFDRLVIATGVDAPTMLAPLGYTLQLLHKPGALVHSKPQPIMTRFVYDGPGELEWKQAADGSVVGLEAGNPPPKPVHADIRDHVMDFPPGIAEMHGARILSKLAPYMPGLAHAEVGSVTLGFRPYPSDGFPVVGPVPGVPAVSLCVTHSGVTLAPLLGDYMASEVIAGFEEPMLAPYRPTRQLPAPASV